MVLTAFIFRIMCPRVSAQKCSGYWGVPGILQGSTLRFLCGRNRRAISLPDVRAGIAGRAAERFLGQSHLLIDNRRCTLIYLQLGQLALSGPAFGELSSPGGSKPHRNTQSDQIRTSLESRP
jgi:hypothetical protein